MNYEEFFAEASRRQIRLSDDRGSDHRATTLGNEALFQLPLLAMAILMLAKGIRKPELSEIGQLVGECLERSIPGFKGSSQGIGWSANLRIRTVKALTFLEVAGLIVLSHRRSITVTEKGRAVVDLALSTDGRLSYALVLIDRTYQNISAESQLQLRLT